LCTRRTVGKLRGDAWADPAGHLRQRLEGFRGRLRSAGVAYCDGLAFGNPGQEGGP